MRGPFAVFGASLLFIALSVIIEMAITNWSFAIELCVLAFWRVLEFLGETLGAILFAVWVAVAPWLWERKQLLRLLRSGLRTLMREATLQFWTLRFKIALLSLVGLFVWQAYSVINDINTEAVEAATNLPPALPVPKAPTNIRMPSTASVEPKPESILASFEEIADFAMGIVIGITTENFDPIFRSKLNRAAPPRDPGFTGTGFWVREPGYAATCYSAVHTARSNRAPFVGMPAPFLSNSLMQLYNATWMSRAAIRAESETGIAILKVHQNPFDGLHLQVGSEKQRYWVPELKTDLAHVGQEVFGIGVAQGDVASFSTFEGKIVRIGGSQISPSGIRLFSTLPYRPEFCGGPVLDNHKVVIGMMWGTENGETVIMPSLDIVHLLQRETANLGL